MLHVRDVKLAVDRHLLSASAGSTGASTFDWESGREAVGELMTCATDLDPSIREEADNKEGVLHGRMSRTGISSST
jgi:hypothetical protein